jgi:hypothetical protein
MRVAYVHEAVIAMAVIADIRAPGAAVTLALCGSWDHVPPCPLAAHHTGTERVGNDVRVRVLFAADPADEALVREKIDAVLAAGEQTGPDGAMNRWRLVGSGPGTIAPVEAAHAKRLTEDGSDRTD